jgi:hypothetical protein
MISFEEDDRGLVLLHEVENNDPEWASEWLSKAVSEELRLRQQTRRRRE